MPAETTLIQVATATATLAIIAGGHRWLSVVSLAFGVGGTANAVAAYLP